MRPVAHYFGAGPTSSLFAAPPSRDFARSTVFPYYGNDKANCCTVSALYDRLTALASFRGQLFAGTDELALADFAAISGWDGAPGSPTDRGLMMIDVLVHAKMFGIGGSKILGYARVDHTDGDLMRQVCNEFGCVYVGAELPRALDHQGFDWDMPPLAERDADHEPDPTRGHAFLYTGYDRLRWQVTTYASSEYSATNEWDATCVDEAWAIFDQSLIDAAPAGLNMALVRSDLAALAL